MIDPVMMKQAIDRLSKIIDPVSGENIIKKEMVKNISLEDQRLRVDITFDQHTIEQKIQMEKEVKEALRDISGGQVFIYSTTVQKIEWSQEREKESEASSLPTKSRIEGVKKIIAVASGKGGVGKTTVAVNLAVAMKIKGKNVGLLDADIYGPNVPTMLGIYTMPQPDPDKKIKPVEHYGVKVISIGFFVELDTPIIWRGPLVNAVIKQFLYDVKWGELDYLVVDLPPGTGDAQLTLVQNVPIDGAVIVTTPQDVALIDARKGLEMFRKLNTRIIGIVENMSYFTCPNCGHRSNIFKQGGGKKTSALLGVPLLGEIPINHNIALSGDAGVPIVVSEKDSPQGKLFLDIAEKIISDKF